MRKSYLFRLILMITITIMIVMAFSPIALAFGPGDVSGSSAYQTKEVGPVNPVVPSDSGIGGAPITSTSTESLEEIVIHNHYVYVDGHVCEDLDLQTEDTLLSIENKRGIKGVIVSDGDDYTDSAGYYKIYPEPGEYHLSFRYGDVAAVGRNGATVSDILTYNGHDYIVSSVGGSYKVDSMSVTYSEIVNSGKGACQVYLLVDGSNSMHDEITINGVTTTKFKQVLNSSKTIIHELLSEGNNIYIGIIAFAGKSWRAAGLSKDEAFLMEVIDQLPELDGEAWAGNTNIYNALDKALNSFYVDETIPDYLDHCNRNIILVSDGFPSATDTCGIAYEDTPEQWYDKMINYIIPDTKQKIADIRAEGINVAALTTPTTDMVTLEVLDMIYNGNVDMYRMAHDEAEISSIIKSDIEEWIESQIQEETEFNSHKVYLTGFEDADRREEVDCNFDQTTWHYYYDTGDGKIANRSVIFSETENNTYAVSAQAQELSDKTYMTVDGGDHHIDHRAAECPLNGKVEYIEVERPDGTTYTKTRRTICVDTGYTINMNLERREQFTLYTRVTATGLKVTLSDGTVLCNKTREMDDPLPLMEIIDNQICHGAVIEIEYTIEVINSTPILCTHLELVTFIPQGFLYSDDYKYLTSEGSNADANWLECKLEDLYNIDPDTGRIHYKISQKTKDKFEDRQTNVVTYTVDNDGKGTNGFYLNTNQAYTTKLVVSRVLDTADDLQGYIESDAEILGYSNLYKENKSRRMNVVSSSETSKGNLIGIYPGDTKLYNLSNIVLDEHTLEKIGSGIDYAPSSNVVYIIPPTGSEKFDKVVAIISLTLTTITILSLTKVKKIRRK